MSGSIYYVNGDESTVELTEAKYDSEDLFQRLIEQHPGILAGDQITPEQPRKWIFIKREMGVPSQEGGNDQWFLDHLFIDQDAIPTFVEVKRSTDTRIRREVVAQMLDYAANAVAYWPVEKIRELYEARFENSDIEPLSELEMSPDEADSYWEKVDSNLRLGKLRLLFVADEMPSSLQRIIEFLNDQMTNTEVLGLEIKQFISKGNERILVPKIIGKTQAAVQAKSRSGFAWTEETYFEHIRKHSGAEAEEVCRKALKAFQDLGCRIYWGRGAVYPSFVPIYDGLRKHQLGAFYSYNQTATIEIYLKHLKEPYNQAEKQRELQRKFNSIDGIIISDDKLFKRPTFDYTVLADPVRFNKYIDIYRDLLDDIKRYEAQELDSL